MNNKMNEQMDGCIVGLMNRHRYKDRETNNFSLREKILDVLEAKMKEFNLNPIDYTW